MNVHGRELYEWANAQISDEELERRRKEPGGNSTEEVLARLRALDAPADAPGRSAPGSQSTL